MGNYRFRVSDIMPNSWFYKLKEMGRVQHHSKRITTASTSSTNGFKSSMSSSLQPHRHAYYFSTREQTEEPSNSPSFHRNSSDTQFPSEPPSKTTTKTRKKLPINHPLSANPTSSVFSATDIIFEFDELSVHRLRPILTKPAQKETKQTELLDAKQVMLRKAQKRIRRIKVKEVMKVVQASRSRKMLCRKRLSESFVVVKKSADPYGDFKESMMEMIIENDIRGCEGLEELLACYLSLNSAEHHDLIVDVFKEIWVDLTELINLEH